MSDDIRSLHEQPYFRAAAKTRTARVCLDSRPAGKKPDKADGFSADWKALASAVDTEEERDPSGARSLRSCRENVERWEGATRPSPRPSGAGPSGVPFERRLL